MQIVTVVHQGVDALRATRLDVGPVDCGRVLVGFNRRCVVARADVDMSRHVHDVSRRWRHGGQPVGPSQGPLRRLRGFHRVNVVVDRA